MRQFSLRRGEEKREEKKREKRQRRALRHRAVVTGRALLDVRPRDGDGNDAAHAVSLANPARSIAVRRVAIVASSSARRFRSRRVARFARGVARQGTPRIFRSGNILASACGCRPETYRAARRATVGFAATLAPTKVEVEAERQKAIFSVWCL